jgi:HprK-related kinase A
VNLSGLAADELARRVRTKGLAICCGPFVVRVVSPIPAVARGLKLLYADYTLPPTDDFADFELKLAPPRGLRRWLRPQVAFSYDGFSPFEPLPIGHAFPLFEWALNWCISYQAHQYLILHAAVIERGGRALIMPAPPGSGKSTLCAGLISRGWRLLSDELTMIETKSRRIVPLGRPISLKNESLDVIRKFVPGVIFNEVTHDTTKGSVTHMKVPLEHIRRLDEAATPGWIVFPKYVAGAPAALTPRSKADSIIQLGRNAFNYALLGLSGFEVLGDVVDASDGYDFVYGDLDDAVAVFDRLQPPDSP